MPADILLPHCYRHYTDAAIVHLLPPADLYPPYRLTVLMVVMTTIATPLFYPRRDLPTTAHLSQNDTLRPTFSTLL